MRAKRRERHAPYYAEHSAARDASRARQECEYAKLGAKALGSPWLYKLTQDGTRMGEKLGRSLCRVGREVAEARGAESARRKAEEVPVVNTSFGIVVERVWRLTAADEKRSMLFRLALKFKSAEAMKALKDGRLDKAREAILEAITG